MSAAAKLLARLERVRQTVPGRWIASSPTRADKHPSLTIRELDDGRLLLHDFGGNSVGEILDSIGMGYGDLFPERDVQDGKPERRPFPAADILRAVAFEALVVATAGTALLSGRPFSEVDRERLILAVSRIQTALTAGGLHHG